MFTPDFPIEKLRPADYNPRKIDQDSVDKLVESLRTLGIIKPVVALQDGLIVAGHQRTRAAKLAGFTQTPVCFLSKKPNAADEIRFNQLHNGTDLDSGDEDAWVPPSDEPGFKMVKLERGNFRAAGAGTRTELARMLTAYLLDDFANPQPDLAMKCEFRLKPARDSDAKPATIPG